MDFRIRTFQEDGVTPTTSGTTNFTVAYLTGGVETTLTTTGNDITVSDIDADTLVDITIEQTGRFTYRKKVKVYHIDADIAIKLVTEITDIDDPNYMNPYAFTFTMYNPCAYSVDVYNASSSPYGEHTNYFNNEYKAAGADLTYVFPSAGQYQVKRRVAVYDAITGTLAWDQYYANGAVAVGSISNTVEQNLDLDTTTNVDLPEIKPQVEIIVNSPADILLSTTYYNIGETITIQTAVTLTTPYVQPEDTILEYIIIDPNGNRVTPSVQAVNLSIPMPDTTTTFKVEKRGDYTVQAIITDVCGSSVTEKILPVYNFVQFLPKSENNYDVYNASNSIPISFNVQYLTSNGFEFVQTDTTLPIKERFDLLLSKQGVYLITVTYTDLDEVERTEYTILYNYAGLRACFTDMIMTIFCNKQEGCGCGSGKVNTENQLDEMLALGQTYFMHLQAEYGFNNIYTALDNSKLVQITTIDTLLQKLSRYCKVVTCTGSHGCACAACMNKPPTTLQVLEGRLSYSASKTDCGCK